MKARYYISFDAINYSEFFPSNEPKLTLQRESDEKFFRWKVDKFRIARSKNETVYDSIYTRFFDHDYFGDEINYKINILGTDKFFFIDPLTSGKLDSQNAVYESTPDTDDMYRPILQSYDKKWQERVEGELFGESSGADGPTLNTAPFINVNFTTFSDIGRHIHYTNTAVGEQHADQDLDVLTFTNETIIVVIKNLAYVGQVPRLYLVDGGGVAKSAISNITTNGVYYITQTGNGANILLRLSQVDLTGASSGTFDYDCYYPLASVNPSGDLFHEIIDNVINGATYLNLGYTIKSTILWNDALGTDPPPAIDVYITANPANDYVIEGAALWNGLYLMRTHSFTTAKEDVSEYSLKDLMNCLRKIRCYWFIDEDDCFRIEHERYFREYTPQADLTSATFDGDKPEVDERVYRYERGDSYRQVNYSENNQSHEDWLAYPAEFSVLETSKNVKDINFNDITTDYEYVRDNPGDASSSGLMLLRTVGVAGFEIIMIDESTLTAGNYYANAKLGWAWLTKNYYDYFAEAQSGTINNGVAITYTHVKEYLKQDNVRFRLLPDLDWKKPFTLIEGTGWIESAELNPETGMYKVDFGFDPYGIEIIIVDDEGTPITPDDDEIYPVLYNWFAANHSPSLAPAGWHVPTLTERATLITFLGGQAVAGGHLKETGLTYWLTPNTGADNSSGFSAKGSGYRDYIDGSFETLLGDFYFWLSNQVDADLAWYEGCIYNTAESANQTFGYTNKKCGFSIRLIKDDSTDPGTMTDYDGNVYPTVKIGTQVWMAEDLKVKHYNDGMTIMNITDDAWWSALTWGAMCYYNNNDGTYIIQ